MGSTNGSANRCRLLELPGEIRNHVYTKLGEDTPGVIHIDLLDPKNTTGGVFALANTCKQIGSEVSSEFYGVRSLKISGPLLEEEPTAEKAAKRLDCFVRNHVLLRKPREVELHVGWIELLSFPEMWSSIEGSVRQLSKTCQTSTLVFDGATVGLDHIHLPIEDADTIASSLQAAYFNEQHKADLMSTGDGDDNHAARYLLVIDYIMRSLRPVWWVRQEARGRWRARNGEKIKEWFKMGEVESRHLLEP